MNFHYSIEKVEKYIIININKFINYIYLEKSIIITVTIS